MQQKEVFGHDIREVRFLMGFTDALAKMQVKLSQIAQVKVWKRKSQIM